MSPGPVSWYHIWVGDQHHGSAWLGPAEEHFSALRHAEFTKRPGAVRVGLVGAADLRTAAEAWLSQQWPQAVVIAQADEGFEQVTLDPMHAWAQTADPSTPVLYCHTKGAFQADPMNHRWRRAMTRELVGSWPERVAELEEFDAVGLHWLTHEQYPDWIDPRKPMFGGNFWWVRAGYLASLERVRGTPEFPPVNRWEAEGWLGQKFPKVKCLKNGWPDYTRYDGVSLASCSRTAATTRSSGARSSPGW